MRNRRRWTIVGFLVVLVMISIVVFLLTRQEQVKRDFDGVTMVLVPAGCFMMGSTDNGTYNNERPVHEACFDEPFWIDQTEVTQGEFERMGGVQAIPSQFFGDNRPVENITWFEAQDFCVLRGAHLPTEAEWEYAARGPESFEYPWGDEWDASKAVWNRGESEGTADVGSLLAGASWVGALDMSGNVYEWLDASLDASTGQEADDFRILRGGAWNADAYQQLYTLKPAFISSFYADQGFFTFGFRCARSD